jgi:2-keto-4-pentenoate hydratase/2-oxohepta-3-ene-1,7-dioic acid hydratase in catechol pathway
VGDPQALELTLSVNGERRQQGTTREMAFGVGEIVRYVSQFMTLEGGDVISTGTPAGVGLGMKPPVYLKHGDVCELAVRGLGSQKQTFRQG